MGFRPAGANATVLPDCFSACADVNATSARASVSPRMGARVHVRCALPFSRTRRHPLTSAIDRHHLRRGPLHLGRHRRDDGHQSKLAGCVPRRCPLTEALPPVRQPLRTRPVRRANSRIDCLRSRHARRAARASSGPHRFHPACRLSLVIRPECHVRPQLRLQPRRRSGVRTRLNGPLSRTRRSRTASVRRSPG